MIKQILFDCGGVLAELNFRELMAEISGSQEAADYHGKVTVPMMQALRKDADLLEKLTAKTYWPYPTYSDILYY